MRTTAVKIVKQLTENKHVALFAGGSVRDHIMGLEPSDYDIATSATPDEVEALFDKVIDTGKLYGTVTVLMGGLGFEVTTFRADIKYNSKKSRHPVVGFTENAKTDALRRDFTINGLFENPLKGEIIDLVGGLVDIKAGLINTIGSPKDRFEEDPLRILRAIRFTNRFNYRMQPRVKAAIEQNLELIQYLSKERIKEELDKMWLQCPPEFLFDLWNILPIILPKYQGNLAHTLQNIKKIKSKSLPCLWAIFFLEMSTYDIIVACKAQLRASNLFTRHILYVTKGWTILNNRPTTADIRILAADPRWDTLYAILALNLEIKQKVDKVLLCYGTALPSKKITGNILKDLGFMPGPAFKAILDVAWRAQLEEK